MIRHCFRVRVALWAAALLFSLMRAEAQTPATPPADAAPSVGAKISYQLPTDGPLPKTYRVTIAAVDPKDPNWIISEFTSGVTRAVTAENQGKFTETWDGLDDNFMPVPPGTYALKGIYMPAEKWAVDGQYHTIVPKLTAMGSSWGHTPSEDMQPRKIRGDPVGSPLADVDVAENGKGSVYFQYLENGTNYFLTDFTKPIGYDQIITGYPSGVFAGGSCTCTDGTNIWSFSTDGGPKFVGRADGQPFGNQNANRHNVFLPEGWVKALAAWPDKDLGHTVVFVAEGGRIESEIDLKQKKLGRVRSRYEESKTDLVDEVLALDGNDAHALATWKVEHPLGIAARHGKLYILHGAGAGYEVLTVPLTTGWAAQQPSLLFKVPEGIKPFDIEADSHGRVYLSDPTANHVYQFDAGGQKLRTYGKLDAQKGGTYDPETFMSPQKLACWTDDKGLDRLLVVEMGGPNRLSEWSGDDGAMIRQWVVPQTRANDGYSVDPKNPNLVYLPGQQNTLVRWKIDYTTGTWTPDAVWYDVGTSHGGTGSFGSLLPQNLASPRLIYRGDDVYLAFWRGYMIYHLEGDHWRPCSGIFVKLDADNKTRHYYLWRDLNGDGQVQENEYLPFETEKPQGVLRYFGETFSDDFSLVCMGQNTSDIWSLTPTSFDSRGTPIYDPKGWKKVLTDDVFEAKKTGTALATRGGNEVGTSFSSDWASVTKAPSGDVYVSARSGPNISSNYGTQYKLSRYVPDGKGGYKQLWRVGRMSFQGVAQPGEVYGPIFVSPPINGLVGLVDNTRAGFVIYTEDGLYVDTLFADSRITGNAPVGVYTQGGEYFTGYDYINKDNGKIYMALGKLMPEIFEAQGWTTTVNPVQPLTALDKTVTLAANQIAAPTEMALQIRGGAAAAKVARFYPAPGGGPALDGSMNGWEACDPVQFSSGTAQTIEARCYYDPDHLYIRWHARLGHPFAANPLDLPQHIFAHERGNDTLGLYLQGDPNAAPGGSLRGGRPGDVRFVFGIFKDGDKTSPVVVGMYPSWSGAGASPQTYTTPVGSVSFAHVGIVPGVTSGYKIDADGQGFVLAAAIPRTAIPGSPKLSGWSTEGNLDANLGGLDRFWWSDADGSASRETYDEPTEARLYPGSWSAVQCLPIDNLPIHSWMAIGPFGFPGVENLDVQTGRDQVTKTLRATVFPPDTTRDMTAVYQGDLAHTRVANRKLAWKNEEISVDLLDISKALAWKGYNDEGTFYLLTHIYSPDAAEVTLQLNKPHGRPYFSGQLNGKPLPEVNDHGARILDESKPLSLQPGWNELLIRDDHIWSDLHIGGKLMADPAVLWKLKISGPPPAQP